MGHVPALAVKTVLGVFCLVLAWQIIFTKLQPEATLSGWEPEVTVSAETVGEWQTRVIPNTLWQPGWQWCSLHGGFVV